MLFLPIKISLVCRFFKDITRMPKRSRRETEKENVRQEKFNEDKLFASKLEIKDKLYCCKHCDFKCVLISYAKRHVNWDCLEQPLKRRALNKDIWCPLCPLKFHSKTDYNIHFSSDHMSDKYQCPVCPEKFTRKTYLSKHLKIHEPNSPVTCSTCGKGCRDSADLNRHLVRHMLDREAENINGAFLNQRLQLNVEVSKVIKMFNLGLVEKHVVKIEIIEGKGKPKLEDTSLSTWEVVEASDMDLLLKDSVEGVSEEEMTAVSCALGLPPILLPVTSNVETETLNSGARNFIFTNQTVSVLCQPDMIEQQAEDLEHLSETFCIFCDVEFKYASFLKTHKQQVHAGPVDCTRCGKLQKSKAAMLEHRKTCTLECEVCGYKTTKPKRFSDHEGTHKRLLDMN